MGLLWWLQVRDMLASIPLYRMPRLCSFTSVSTVYVLPYNEKVATKLRLGLAYAPQAAELTQWPDRTLLQYETST